MKKFAMALMAGMLVATGVQVARAEGGQCPMCEAHMDGGKKADKLAFMLDLTDKQKAAVKNLNEARMKRVKPAMEQFQSQSIQANDEFEAGLKKVLNAKQQAKYEKWMDMEKSEDKDCH